MSVCQGCGGPLPPSKPHGRPRKWCSGRCRKRSYGDPCVDCGAKTRYGAEMARIPEPRCVDCARTKAGTRRVTLALEMMRLRREERLNNREIAARVGTPRQTVANELLRLRALGFTVPAAPYNNARLGTGLPVADASAATLADDLRAAGIAVPVDTEAAAA